MTSRIDLELTSDRDDGSWTWRAAGAKNPKGTVAAALLPDGAKVGDVLRADAEFEIEGIEVVKVFAPKAARSGPELLELLGSGNEQPLVTTQLVKGSRGGRGDRRGGGRGRDRDGGGFDRGGRGGGGRGGGRDGGRGGGRDGGRGRDGGDRKPRAQRLRPQRKHRDAWLDGLPAEQRPVAEQLMESMQPAFTAADWRDRAEAALAGVSDVDLRDLRSVVGASEAGARDEETRALADQLRTKVNARIDTEHEAWLSGLKQAISQDRIVRALRQSARPVKLGSPLPDGLVQLLVEGANKALADDVEPDRWATVLDAVAFSPVRQLVVPAGTPEEDDAEVTAAVTKLANRVPQIAALFGIEVAEKPRNRKGRGKGPAKDNAKGKSDAKSKGASDDKAAAKSEPEESKKAPTADDAKDKGGSDDKAPVDDKAAAKSEPEESKDAPAADEAAKAAPVAAEEAANEAPAAESPASEAAPAAEAASEEE